MLAVALSETDIIPYMESSQTSLACINSPKNVTVAGPQEQIKAIHAELEKVGILAKS